MVMFAYTKNDYDIHLDDIEGIKYLYGLQLGVMPRNYTKELGARPYKNCPPEKLAEAVRKVIEGKMTFRKAAEEAQTTIQKKQRAANQKNVKAANKKEGKATLRKRLESESESDVDEPSFSLQDTDESVGLDFSSSEDVVTDSFANAQPHTSTPHVNTTLEPMPCSSKQHPHPAEAIEIENLTNEEIRCEVGDFVAVRSWGSNPLD
ncbi:hypothetical protein GE061_015823 [Apolygus lucorum]|uniref:HTH psq-type domain-containing protein n=1 Tax=Apolygus lucorum TaxID=248454 RepID=A0A8S9XM89_APOLU|nr:hypothetical protein GE061_015823 [Apolygus lucorum]